MRIQKIEADSWQQAIRLVKEQLGPDALILSTRRTTRKGGGLGLFGRPVVEVTVALEEGTNSETVSRLAGRRSASGPSGKAPAGENPLSREVEDVRTPPEVMQRSLEAGQRSRERRESPFDTRGILDPELDLPPDATLLGLARELRKQGVSPLLVQECLGQMGQALSAEELERPGYARGFLAALMRKLIPLGGALRTEEGGAKTVVFVGPTGVGKTTTIAKLASHYSLVEKKKVALVTIDTYRVGSVEQLQTYARLLSLPLEVALSPAALGKLLAKHRDKDLILVDTAGSSQRNGEKIEDLAAFFRGRRSLEAHLLLAATTKDEEMGETVRSFGRIPLRRLLFTKLDEALSAGNLFNQAVFAALPLSYFTTGQRVPEDIEAATARRLVDLILPTGGRQDHHKENRGHGPSRKLAYSVQ